MGNKNPVLASVGFLQLLSLLATVNGQSVAGLSVDFDRDIRPILSAKCFACHGPDGEQRAAELRLDQKGPLFGKTESGRRPVVAGNLAASELWRRINLKGEERMPPGDADPITSAERTLIRKWIEQGATWKQHWAFRRPQRPRLPQVSDANNPIDRFVKSRLRGTPLKPTAEADRATLIRRLTLDLTGLPPSPLEVQRFVEDRSPHAYEKLVDRLLDSPHYGERMAIDWLDASRYADTHGYLFDTQRSMWRWREWVIDAFNRNQPFDEFTIEQLAGDLLENSTVKQRLATGFNRNHLINNEAGATAAEYLVENVIDRVNTVSTVWMGLSLACCQCHDHKYDPFTQREYYQLYAYFNTIPELGLDGLNQNARPTMQAPTPAQLEYLKELKARIASTRNAMKGFDKEIDVRQLEWEAKQSKESRSPAGLAAYWGFDGDHSESQKPREASVFEAGNAKFEGGVLSKSAVFDGLGYVQAGKRFGWKRTNAFTIAAWIKMRSREGRLSIVSRMLNAKDLFRGYTVQVFGGKPSIFLLNSFPDNMLQVEAKTQLELDRWYHFAVTYDGSSKVKGIRLYLDGKVEKPGITIDKLSESIAADAPFWIGNGHPAAKFKGWIDDVRVYERVLDEKEIAQLPGLTIESLLAGARDQRGDEQRRRIREYYLENAAPESWRKPYRELVALENKLKNRQRSLPTVMVMKEQPKPKKTFLLKRGAYNRPGEEVKPATPSVLPKWRSELPANRLGFARWLVDPQHPLTARVAVNRYWQQFFGRGLVATTEDFGVQGSRPTHPELLDWLAVEFVESGWNIKRLQRLIVTSATYRQSSKAARASYDYDPDNQWLARGPRFRLPAEVIRDQALAASGLLVREYGGPSVRPYQPDGLWREVAFDFSGNLTAQIYKADSGASLYRRSLYTFWKRTSPPPTMLLFDAPDRERCVVRRQRTSTPLQALALMNDPTFVEAARKMAERVLAQAPRPSAKSRIEFAFRLLLARRPNAQEAKLLTDLLKGQQVHFRQKPKLAMSLLKVGASGYDKRWDANELAAYSVLCSLLLNLDETTTNH